MESTCFALALRDPPSGLPAPQFPLQIPSPPALSMLSPPTHPHRRNHWRAGEAEKQLPPLYFSSSVSTSSSVQSNQGRPPDALPLLRLFHHSAFVPTHKDTELLFKAVEGGGTNRGWGGAAAEADSKMRFTASFQCEQCFSFFSFLVTERAGCAVTPRRKQNLDEHFLYACVCVCST